MKEIMAGLPTLAITQYSATYSQSFQIIFLLDPSGRAKDAMDFQFCQKKKKKNLRVGRNQLVYSNLSSLLMKCLERAGEEAMVTAH